MNVDRVQLCLRSWFGHPEADLVHENYIRERERHHDGLPLSWTSGLRCWNLLSEEGLMLGRAFEPSEATPNWVFTDDRGNNPIQPPISMARLTALMVEYRLMGGTDA